MGRFIADKSWVFMYVCKHTWTQSRNEINLREMLNVFTLTTPAAHTQYSIRLCESDAKQDNELHCGIMWNFSLLFFGSRTVKLDIVFTSFVLNVTKDYSRLCKVYS